MSNDKHKQLSQGQLVVLSAPSGTGKGTVISEILRQRPEFVFSISATTRAPRRGETHGKEYYFINKSSFQEMISKDEFLEYAEYVGNYYGTPGKPIEEFTKSGKTVILDIEVLGAKQVMSKRPEAVSIFIVPPDMIELENRLRGRGTDTEDMLQARLERARRELEEKCFYKHVVVNDSVSRAAGEIISLIDRKD